MGFRAARVDNNHTEIVTGLKRFGAEILQTYQLKNAMDIVVGFRGKLYLMEIKNEEILPKKFFKMPEDEQHKYLITKLEPGEKKCMDRFARVGVPYHIVYSLTNALEVIGVDLTGLSNFINKELV